MKAMTKTTTVDVYQVPTPGPDAEHPSWFVDAMQSPVLQEGHVGVWRDTLFTVRITGRAQLVPQDGWVVRDHRGQMYVYTNEEFHAAFILVDAP